MSAPYIPLYIDDFDGATAHLTCEEEGAYMRLIKLAWRTPGCSLPNDDAWIARKIRMTPDQFQTVAKPVLAEFFKLVRGRWVQGRLKKESDKLLARNRERSEAGKRGAAAKALKNNEITPTLAKAEHKQPEPEPEPEPEEKKKPSVSKKAASRDCPDEWQPTDYHRELWKSWRRENPEFEREIIKFKNHHFKDAKVDWNRTFTVWLTNADERTPRPLKRVTFV